MVQGEDTGQQKCFVCHKVIAAGGWFCRIPRPEKPIVLCRPSCALHYFDTLHPLTNGEEQYGADYAHRLHFLVDGEKPWA
jgi:hypothetical protein